MGDQPSAPPRHGLDAYFLSEKDCMALQHSRFASFDAAAIAMSNVARNSRYSFEARELLDGLTPVSKQCLKLASDFIRSNPLASQNTLNKTVIDSEAFYDYIVSRFLQESTGTGSSESENDFFKKVSKHPTSDGEDGMVAKTNVPVKPDVEMVYDLSTASPVLKFRVGPRLENTDDQFKMETGNRLKRKISLEGSNSKKSRNRNTTKEILYVTPLPSSVVLSTQPSSDLDKWKDLEDYNEGWKLDRKGCIMTKQLGYQVEPIKIPGKLFRTMLTYPHQVEGIEFLWRRFLAREGAILADEPGLGKTRQTLMTIAAMLYTQRANAFVFIVPKSVLIQWREEAESIIPSAVPKGTVRIVTLKSDKCRAEIDTYRNGKKSMLPFLDRPRTIPKLIRKLMEDSMKW